MFKILPTVCAMVALCALGASAQNLSSLSTALTTTRGEQASISKIGQGRVTVVVFWMTTCHPSKAELEALALLSDTMGEKVAVVAVAIDNTKTIARVGAYVSSKGYRFPVLLDPNRSVYDAVNGTDHPYTLLFRADGTLHSKRDGFIEGDDLKLREELELLVATQASPIGE